VPRYVVERVFLEGNALPAGEEGMDTCLAIVGRNQEEDVTWIHSYVSEDRHRWFCLYEAPSPEAIRRAAARNHLPVDRIIQVRVLDPYSSDAATNRAGGGGDREGGIR
jgi:hypothetical protein